MQEKTCLVDSQIGKKQSLVSFLLVDGITFYTFLYLWRISLDSVENIDEYQEHGDEQGHSARDHLRIKRYLIFY